MTTTEKKTPKAFRLTADTQAKIETLRARMGAGASASDVVRSAIEQAHSCDVAAATVYTDAARRTPTADTGYTPPALTIAQLVELLTDHGLDLAGLVHRRWQAGRGVGVYVPSAAVGRGRSATLTCAADALEWARHVGVPLQQEGEGDV